jgi:alpha-beta hydrolase superfamily lysophospholipase
MKPQTFNWKNEYNEKISAWYMRPTSDPHSVICLVHGYGEHSLRYLHWASRFVSDGYAFLTWDHAGHGQSEGQRGHIRNFDQYLNEVSEALKKANEQFPGIPVTLYGHSMGGNIALNYTIRNSNALSLLIATSPWLDLANPVSGFVSGAVNFAAGIFPRLTIKAPLDANDISSIKEEAEKYVSDPLNHSKITLKLLSEITKYGHAAMNDAAAISIPTLMLHGSADKITSFKATSETAEKIPQCSFIPWFEMRHELHNDTVRDDVYKSILEWLSGNID